MSVFTLYDLQPVDAGETVAKAKITPLAMPEALVKQAEERAWAVGGLVTVKAFSPSVLGAVTRENLEARQRQRFESSLTEKAAWFGSRLLPVRYASAVGRLGGGGDRSAHRRRRRDPHRGRRGVPRSARSRLRRPPQLGGTMERHGAPAHPGSLLWLARVRERPVLGMPACGMFSQATTFDLVLPRILTGEPIDNSAMAALGHGGLLSRDSAYRFPPYRKSGTRGELGE